MISGIDFGNVRITTPTSSGSERKNKNDKYLNINEPGEYIIRLVSGFVPFHAHWVNGQGFKICPKTLLIGMEKTDQNGIKVTDKLHKKTDNSYYSEEESTCPICNTTGQTPLTRYAVNVIDRTEQKHNIGGPVPIKILSSQFDVFKEFMTFSNSERQYSPQDPDRGWDFVIRTIEAPGGGGKKKVAFSVQLLRQSPLTEQEKQAVLTKRVRGSETGIWDLMTEYSPLTCPQKMSVYQNNSTGHQFVQTPNYTQSPVTQMPDSVYQPVQQAPQQFIQPVAQPQVPQFIQQPQPVQPMQQQYAQQPIQQQPYVQQPIQQAPQQFIQPVAQPQVPQFIQQPQPVQPMQQQYVQQPMQQQQQQSQYIQQPTNAVQTVQSQIVPVDMNEDTTDAIARLMQGL